MRNIGEALRDSAKRIISVEDALANIKAALDMDWSSSTRVAVLVGTYSIYLNTSDAFVLLHATLEAQMRTMRELHAKLCQQHAQLLTEEQPKP